MNVAVEPQNPATQEQSIPITPSEALKWANYLRELEMEGARLRYMDAEDQSVISRKTAFNTAEVMRQADELPKEDKSLASEAKRAAKVDELLWLDEEYREAASRIAARKESLVFNGIELRRAERVYKMIIAFAHTFSETWGCVARAEVQR